MRRATTENAPHFFMIYWRMDVTALFRLAGGTRQCVEYLMGNHVIAERMYWHDPAAMLYAPLRLAIYDSSPAADPAADPAAVSREGETSPPVTAGSGAPPRGPSTSITIDHRTRDRPHADHAVGASCGTVSLCRETRTAATVMSSTATTCRGLSCSPSTV
ncbi:hypothetical protein AB1460_06120 [Parafrankia sp. FMc2]